MKGKGYRGVLAVGKNPAALSVETCSTYGTVGQKIGVTAEEHDGVLAMNASGFLDPGRKRQRRKRCGLRDVER